MLLDEHRGRDAGQRTAARPRSPAPRSWKPSAPRRFASSRSTWPASKKEREIIEQHLATVEQQLATARQLLDQAIAENRRLADELGRRDGSRSGTAPAKGPLAVSR